MFTRDKCEVTQTSFVVFLARQVSGLLCNPVSSAVATVVLYVFLASAVVGSAAVPAAIAAAPCLAGATEYRVEGYIRGCRGATRRHQAPRYGQGGMVYGGVMRADHDNDRYNFTHRKKRPRTCSNGV